MEVLSASPTPPFSPHDFENVNEERRLQYRYLDLRRPEMQQTLRTRYRVTKMMRLSRRPRLLGNRNALPHQIDA